MKLKSDYIKIGKAAAKRYIKLLTKDEIKSCIMFGIAVALNKHDGRSKLETFIFNNVRWECLKQIRFNNKTHYELLDHVYITQKEDRSSPFDILIDNVVYKVSQQKIAEKYSLTKKEVSNKLKVLKELYISMNS